MKPNRKFDRIRDTLPTTGKPRFAGSRALKRMISNPLSVLGLIVFSIIVLSAVFAPLISAYSPLKIDLRGILKPPSWEHWFGTDKLGRDIFARVLYGGQISILIGLGSALGAAAIGVALGAYGGYKGGWIDRLFLRVSEIFMSFPQIILVLLLVSIIGQSVTNLMVIFIITGWGSIYRMARSRMLSIREEEYVLALKAFGLNDLIICYKHMLPNAMSPIIVNITLSTAMFILQEAALSFLGLGVPLEISTWGNILNVANDLNVLARYWWIWLPVGTVISLFVLSVNFIGDGLRDSTDPSQLG
ncbi:MAG: ABC transporter permease [Spirochaetales bacterium]